MSDRPHRPRGDARPGRRPTYAAAAVRAASLATVVLSAFALVVGGALAGAGDSRTSREVERAVAALADVTGGDPARRAAAVDTLAAAARDGTAPRALVVAALVAGLADPIPDLRLRAAGALSQAVPRDADALAGVRARFARERDEAVLAGLLLAAGALGTAADVATLVPFFAAPSPRLRAAAATAVGDLGGAAARARLLALLASAAASGDDPDWAVRGAVLLALARCGERADAGTILVAYRDGGGAHRWFARAALATVVAALDADPVPVLDRLIADEDARVSSAAAVAFVRCGRPGEVVTRLSDVRPGVRAAAAAAVADGGLVDEAPRLRGLATDDPDRAVRWSAALALSRLDDPAADAMLVAGLASNDPQVWASAIAECRRKTGLALGRDADAWADALAARRKGGRR